MPTSLDAAAILEARNTAYIAGYNALFSGKVMQGGYLLWTRKIPTKTKTVELGMLTNVPQMRRWRGMRQAKSPRAYKQTMQIDVHESTVDLERMDVMYDTTGLFDEWIQAVLRAGGNAYDQLMTELWLSNTFAGPVGYDGVSLFSASHPHGPGGTTNGNIATSTPISYSAIRTALYTASEWKQENGEPFAPTFDTLEVQEFNRLKAQELFAQDRIVAVDAAGAQDVTASAVAAAGRSNGLVNAMKVVVNKRFASSTSRGVCTLLDTSMAEVRPMNLLEARFPEPVLENQMQSHRRVREDKYYLGLDGDYDGHAGAWPTCYRLVA
jgi:phage major head subunit gpT-like protein